MKNAIVAISTGPSTHLDHLAPLCQLLKAPLIVTEPDHEELARKFYPMVTTHYLPLSELSLERLATFDTILTCGKFWAMELRPALEMITKKEVRFVFSPHGYSDKEDFLEKKVEQDIQLIYSQGETSAENTYAIGNLRLAFYQKHKAHFDTLAAPFFQTEKKVVLYAPTWESKATPTSFFEKIDEVVESLANDYHLLIKLHPLLEENNKALYHRAIGKYESSAQFIENFPPIYPLLEKTDIYLGDFSSIGYDFLVYDRPLFFLKMGGKLDRCGKPFTGSVCDTQEELSAIRRETVQKVFGNGSIKEILEWKGIE